MEDDSHHNNAFHNDVFHMPSSPDTSLNIRTLQNTYIHFGIFHNDTSFLQVHHMEGRVVNDNVVDTNDHKEELSHMSVDRTAYSLYKGYQKLIDYWNDRKRPFFPQKHVLGGLLGQSGHDPS